MSYDIFELRLMDDSTKIALTATGGVVYVAQPGLARKATLYDPDNGFASLANPVTPKNGRIRFALSTGVSGQAVPQSCDLYGISGEGLAFQRLTVKPGAPDLIYLDSQRAHQRCIIPFSILDTTANTETDTKFVLPTGAVIEPNPVVNVRTNEAARTLNVGLLSSQSGGSANGLVNGLSLATAGVQKATVASGAVTLGSMLFQAYATTPAVDIPEGKVVTAANPNVSYTLSASTANADGFIILQYDIDILAL